MLVVDDDATTRRVMSRLVKRLLPGCSVATAADGAAAVQYVTAAMQAAQGGGDDDTAAVPDFITMDNQMPLMTGQEAAAALRGAGYTGRIVGVTGNAVGGDGAAFIAAGVDAVVFKPASAQSMLDGLLGQKSQR